jgi:hypothetical protein
MRDLLVSSVSPFLASHWSGECRQLARILPDAHASHRARGCCCKSSIVGNQLLINASPDFETKSSYSIRVRATDLAGLSFEKTLVISILDQAEGAG